MAAQPSGRVRAYVGLGGNLDDPVSHVRGALEDLRALGDTCCVRPSGLYRSLPVGPVAQPSYVNAVACLDTGLSPWSLLAALQGVEARHGRVRGPERWGPRTLDLDLLVYGAWRSCDARLTVPHPELAGRAFVLVPLLEIAPDLDVPGLARVRDLARAVGSDGVEALE
jgi:2-amino-4-hydroxy-6-hydroxymethyldihydropteridine diphosphokinase